MDPKPPRSGLVPLPAAAGVSSASPAAPRPSRACWQWQLVDLQPAAPPSLVEAFLTADIQALTTAQGGLPAEEEEVRGRPAKRHTARCTVSPARRAPLPVARLPCQPPPLQPFYSRSSELSRRRWPASMPPQSSPAPSSLPAWKRATCCPRQACAACRAAGYAAGRAHLPSRNRPFFQRGRSPGVVADGREAVAGRRGSRRARRGCTHVPAPHPQLCRAARGLTPRCCAEACGVGRW